MYLTVTFSVLHNSKNMSQCKLSDFNINLEFVDTSTVTGQYFESQKYITDGPKPYSHYDWSHLILYKGVEVKRSS